MRLLFGGEVMKTGRAPLVLLLCFALSACAGSTGSHVTPSLGVYHPNGDGLGGVGNIAVVLTDAPPSIGTMTPSEIDLGVTGVSVVSNGTVVPIAQYSQPVVVNILQYQDSAAPIGIGQYFQGTYQQVQFTFDIASSKIVANSTSYPIEFENSTALSSAGAGATTTTSVANGQATVTVNGNFLEGSNPAASIEADFNALESFAQTSTGEIVSRPTVFAVPYDQAGMIAGTVVNAAGSPVTNATIVALDANGHVANTTSTDSTGAFSMHTLAAGTYQLTIYNAYTTASGESESASGNSNTSASVAGPSVAVTAGQTTQVAPIKD